MIERKLELCIDSLQSALVADEAKADRIELCSHLDSGGLSPSYGLLSLVKERVSLPIHILIRPRAGDFCYDDSEFEVMQREVELAKKMEIAGVVIGILEPDGKIDIDRMRVLVELAKPMSITFHRAFDFCSDPYKALQEIIDLGCDRLLTSGQKRTAMEGANLIKELHQRAEGRLIVMPGSGINSQNAMELIKMTGVREIHASASKAQAPKMIYQKEGLALNYGGAEELIREADRREIEKLRSIVKG